jgi:hypothetical protein
MATVDLEQALKAIKPGGVLQLDPANTYPAAYLRKFAFDPPVTIKGAPGAVLQGVTVQNSSGIAFSGVEVCPGGVTVQSGCPRITLDTCKVHGAAKPGDGGGITFNGSPTAGCPNGAVTNCEIYYVGTGLQVLFSDHFLIANNHIHDITGDTFKSNGSSFVTVDGNTLGPVFTAAGDHPDYIQFFTSNQTKPTTDLTITNNVGARGAGGICQGIFLGDEASVGYQRVKITGNSMIGTMYRGLSVSNGTDVLIDSNTVAGFPDMTSAIFVDGNASGVTVTNNISTGINLPADPKSYTASGNKTLAVPIDGGAALLAALKAPPVVTPPPAVNPLQAQLDAANATIVALRAQLASQREAVAKVFDFAA